MKLRGADRREFQATVTFDHCHGSPRFAHTLFGWDPKSIEKGISEMSSNRIIANLPRTGRRKYTEILPNLDNDIERTPLIERWSLVIKPEK